MSGFLRSNSRGKRVLWVAELILDRDVHKVSRLEILRHLADRGYEVELCAISSKSGFERRGTVKIRCFPLRYVPAISVMLFSLILMCFLPVYVLIKRPRYIFTEPGLSILAFFWKPLLSSCLGVKTILDIRSIPVERWKESTVRRLLFKLSVLIARRFFNGITIITPTMREQVLRDFQLAPGSVGVWSDGVSTALFDPSDYSKDALELKVENRIANAFVVFYHGALTMHRGVIETVKSIRIVKSKYQDVVLFLLGNGPAVPAIRKLIQEEGLDDKVVLHSTVDYVDVPRYIAMSDVGIVPLPDLADWRDQCPLNLLEYLAMEKVVVVTDIPATRAIVGDSKCAIVVPSSDPTEIAKGIIYARERRQMLKQWGRLGRSIVMSEYDWSKVAERLDKYLRRC